MNKVIVLVTWVTHNSRKSNKSYIKTNNKAVILDYKMRNMICQYLNEKITKEEYKIFAKNALDDHVHIIIVCEKDETTNIIRNLKGYSAFMLHQDLKKTYPNLGRQNKLWVRGASKTYFEKDEHFINAMNYVNNNHMKHKLPAINENLQFDQISNFEEFFW